MRKDLGHESPTRVDGPDSVILWQSRRVLVSGVDAWGRPLSQTIEISEIGDRTNYESRHRLTESGTTEQTNSRDTNLSTDGTNDSGKRI